ncbi:hypothetical protein KP806_07620 [Paenibacillus sp. N4]|uniref:terminase large subunit n=1 Tax=Paenibacillus vietnamensis TaxID=2590547 RepID=UPI001CD11D11|nr:terminase TerL endonuclease subunit [Paenibacillus vietnamensis]MCA0754915.1 hypothetical protein [Paenibacillus vietnamensis]
MVKVDKVPSYIQDWHDYVENEPDKHGKDIKALKKLIEKLLKNKTVRYDPTDVEAFISFCRLVRHREGRWAGMPFEPSLEQKYIAACIFGFKMYDKELKMEVRYFRELVLLVARKWGKSSFISPIADFLLMADNEPAAQVWCLATQKQQASIVYESAKAFLQSSEVLTPPDNPRKHWRTKRDRDNSEMLLFPATGSYMKAGGKNSKSQDGLNPHAFIIDECHAIKDRNTYDVFSSAGGARTQPLGVIISTFGFEREGIFDSVLERCKKVLAGDSKERMFPMIFRIDDDDDPADRSCWIKANPGLREARPTMSYLEGEYMKAMDDPAQMPSFLAKHLNRASSLSVVYFDLQEVDQCAGDMDIETMLQDKYAVGAADISETTDLCCATALLPIAGKLHLFQRYFIARERIEKNSKQDKMAYESFTATGADDPLNDELLHICEGSIVRRSDVAEWFAHLANKYEVTFWKIGADRWHFEDFAMEMEKVGFPREGADGRGVVFTVPFGARTLSAPMKETRVLFGDRRVIFSRYNGLFRWCVLNTAAKIDTNNNIQPDKRSSKARIDGYASYLMAYVAYQKVKDDFAAFGQSDVI